MASVIPTSTFVSESTVIAVPIAKVWNFIKLESFAKFWTKLEKAEKVKSASPETDIVRWSFFDGTILDIKLEEHSSIHNFITYSVISSSPSLTYSSVLSTIRCYAVSSGAHEGSTFVTWSGHFSSDADAGVIEDARYKRIEALADLAAAASKA